MIEKKTRTIIQKLSTSIFEKSIDQIEAEKGLNEIHSHFQQITKITGYDFSLENLAAIPAAKGKALGLNFAAQCLLDYKRTTKFLEAIISIIKEKQKKDPGKLINIFYAGCGPYAPFITLVAPLFPPEEIQFSLLEINKNAVKSAKKLIDALDLSGYLKEFYITDAITFKVPNPKSFDILISETLDAVLYRECYVPILFNLLPQFNKNITLIPENVLLNISFVTNSEKESTIKKELDFGNILDVRKAIASHKNLEQIPSSLPDKKIDLSSLNMKLYDRFLLDTKVHIHGDYWLYRNESSLTIPLEFIVEQPFTYNAITFTYFMDSEIELKHQFNS